VGVGSGLAGGWCEVAFHDRGSAGWPSRVAASTRQAASRDRTWSRRSRPVGMLARVSAPDQDRLCSSSATGR
jgi:hypothetical protein